MPGSKDIRVDPIAGTGGIPALGVASGPGQASSGREPVGREVTTGIRAAPMGGREISDEELVQRMREGDGAAGETLCRRYYQPLFRYLQRLSRSDNIAEELHQQTWMSVLEHLDRFDPASSPGGFKAWLFRIATNKANDLWRSRSRERNAKAGLRLVTEQETPAADFRLDGSEQAIKLRKAIEKLPEPQKQVLMLRYYSGMKFVEIAQTLGCPLNTALGRMHKAILKLKSAMEG